MFHGNQRGNNWPLRGQKTSSWEGGVRATAFLWGGKNVLPANLRGTTSNAFIHVSDWYATLTMLVGVDRSDKQAGVPDTDGIDQWATLMKPNAGPADSVRAEIPLAFCPNTDPEKGNRGADNCCVGLYVRLELESLSTRHKLIIGQWAVLLRHRYCCVRPNVLRTQRSQVDL